MATDIDSARRQPDRRESAPSTGMATFDETQHSRSSDGRFAAHVGAEQEGSLSDGEVNTTVEEARQRYDAALAAYDQSRSELSEMLEEAERTGRYEDADDFRHYDHADTTEEALTAARALLDLIG